MPPVAPESGVAAYFPQALEVEDIFRATCRLLHAHKVLVPAETNQLSENLIRDRGRKEILVFEFGGYQLKHVESSELRHKNDVAAEFKQASWIGRGEFVQFELVGSHDLCLETL